MKKLNLKLMSLLCAAVVMTQCVNEPKPKKDVMTEDEVAQLSTKPLPSDVQSDNTSIVNVDSVLAQSKKSKKKEPPKPVAEPDDEEEEEETDDAPKSKPNAAPKPLPKPIKTTKPSASTADKPLTKSDNFSDDNLIKRPGRDNVLKISEVRPSFPGGESALNNFMSRNLRYPARAREDGVQGTVFVRFVVEKDGTVDDVSVAKGVHPLLNAEAKRVVAAMPKWTAGRQSGGNVAVQYTLPVRFELVE